MVLLLGSSRGGSDDTAKLVPVPLGLSSWLPQRAHAQATQRLLHLLGLRSCHGRPETLDFILVDFCYVVKIEMRCIGIGRIGYFQVWKLLFLDKDKVKSPNPKNKQMSVCSWAFWNSPSILSVPLTSKTAVSRFKKTHKILIRTG